MCLKPRLQGTQYAECGLQIAVKYRITVYLHAENDCGRPMFSLYTQFDNPVAKCFTFEKAPFRSGIYSVRYGSLHWPIDHTASAFRVSGKRTTINTLEWSYRIPSYGYCVSGTWSLIGFFIGGVFRSSSIVSCWRQTQCGEPRISVLYYLNNM